MGLPGWREVFDKVERKVGAPLEDAAASPRYGKAVSFWVKGPAAAKRAVRSKVDGGFGGVLHFLSIPARDDVARLSRQLAQLTAEVRALSLPADQISNYVLELKERAAELEPAELEPLAESAMPEEAQSAPARTIPPVKSKRAIGTSDGA